MKTILVIYHTQSGNALKMAQAVVRGAAKIGEVQAVLKRALETTESDLIDCDGLILVSPEYFGYMAGAVKDLFDRTYESLRGHSRIFRKPYAICISAGNDGTGALASIEKIGLGFQFRKIQPPVMARGAVTEEILACCEELGQTMAAGCEAGIY